MPFAGDVDVEIFPFRGAAVRFDLEFQRVVDRQGDGSDDLEPEVVAKIETSKYSKFPLCRGGIRSQMHEVDVPAVPGTGQAGKDADTSFEDPRRVVLEYPGEKPLVEEFSPQFGEGAAVAFSLGLQFGVDGGSEGRWCLITPVTGHGWGLAQGMVLGRLEIVVLRILVTMSTVVCGMPASLRSMSRSLSSRLIVIP